MPALLNLQSMDLAVSPTVRRPRLHQVTAKPLAEAGTGRHPEAHHQNTEAVARGREGEREGGDGWLEVL